ncbi:hypothetical protein LPJ59_001820 [Coemansia sp. RSA 2399]|nr:hypothetical protein LPJ59_001820 [Coemansia sp. RSA 2399]KAJ1906114.1 hypothetical protein LPJ81_001528 [Coemansia sp. IMI 209127]
MEIANRISVLSRRIRAQLASGRTESTVYRTTPLPPVPPIENNSGEAIGMLVIVGPPHMGLPSRMSAIDSPQTEQHPPVANGASTPWSQHSTTAYTSESEEEHAQEATRVARLKRSIRKLAKKYVLYIIPLFVLSIASIVMIAYLVWGNTQPCGAHCNEIGVGGLYLTAFGYCSLLNSTVGDGVCAMNGTTDYFAALNRHQFGRYVEMAASPVCGKCMLVHGPRGKVQAKITDVCMGCANGDIQLSQTALLEIADANMTWIPVSWEPC